MLLLCVKRDGEISCGGGGVVVCNYLDYSGT